MIGNLGSSIDDFVCRVVSIYYVRRHYIRKYRDANFLIEPLSFIGRQLIVMNLIRSIAIGAMGVALLVFSFTSTRGD